MSEELAQTIKEMVVPGKGILAADESNSTAGKRLASIGAENSEEMRRQYRNMILTAPGFENYIVGVILFEETLDQKTDSGVLFPEYLQNLGVVPGIKVDKGLADLEGTDGEQFTQGIEGLGDRLEEYKKKGARFTKWRTVYKISDSTPSDKAIQTNAEGLAKYAKVCQEHGFVPIVEPEVLIEGNHSIDRCHEVTEKVLTALYEALGKEKIDLQYTILKPSMVISGLDAEDRAPVSEVAKRTLQVLKKCVPAEVPSINFLSGGQGAEEATAHLNEMHKQDSDLPWYVSFSYARALQGPALSAWEGKQDNLEAAQNAFIARAKENGLATQGKSAEEYSN